MDDIEQGDWEHPLNSTVWDIRNDGRGWNGKEFESRYFQAPGKMESCDGKLYCTDEDRVFVLGMLLENVGADRAVQLGDPNVWRAAIARLDSDSTK